MSTPTKSPMRTCAHCGHLVPSAQAVCIHCGKNETGEPVHVTAAPKPVDADIKNGMTRQSRIIMYIVAICILVVATVLAPSMAFIFIPLAFGIFAISNADLSSKPPVADTPVSPGVAQIIKKIEYDDDGLAVLTGSPKQIEWATRIRSKRLKQMRKFCRLLKLSKDEDRKYNLISWLERQDESRFWIDSRNEQVYQFGWGSALSNRFIDDADIEKIEEFEDYDELDDMDDEE